MSVKEEIKVSCYEGYRANETPRCFLWRNQPFIIQEIIETSLAEDLSSKRIFGYDVVTSTGEKFRIFFEPDTQKWYISC